MTAPVICFGQQPSGFFPKRFLYAKILAARRLKQEIGGEIVYFFHDSDHDPRETRTVLRDLRTNEPVTLNFSFKNSVQRKFSPLYAKAVPADWQAKTARQLPNYVGPRLVQIFREVQAVNVANFCLEIYRKMGLLRDVRIVRSSAPELREAACAVPDFFVDVPFAGELVRARHVDGSLQLHEGGGSFVTLPAAAFTKTQISPTRDTRLRWMQSVLNCSHYITGASERVYLRSSETPEITFIDRDPIDRFDEAYTELD